MKTFNKLQEEIISSSEQKQIEQVLDELQKCSEEEYSNLKEKLNSINEILSSLELQFNVEEALELLQETNSIEVPIFSSDEEEDVSISVLDEESLERKIDGELYLSLYKKENNKLDIDVLVYFNNDEASVSLADVDFETEESDEEEIEEIEEVASGYQEMRSGSLLDKLRSLGYDRSLIERINKLDIQFNDNTLSVFGKKFFETLVSACEALINMGFVFTDSEKDGSKLYFSHKDGRKVNLLRPQGNTIRVAYSDGNTYRKAEVFPLQIKDGELILPTPKITTEEEIDNDRLFNECEKCDVGVYIRLDENKVYCTECACEENRFIKEKKHDKKEENSKDEDKEFEDEESNSKEEIEQPENDEEETSTENEQKEEPDPLFQLLKAKAYSLEVTLSDEELTTILSDINSYIESKLIATPEEEVPEDSSILQDEEPDKENNPYVSVYEETEVSDVPFWSTVLFKPDTRKYIAVIFKAKNEKDLNKQIADEYPEFIIFSVDGPLPSYY